MGALFSPCCGKENTPDEVENDINSEQHRLIASASDVNIESDVSDINNRLRYQHLQVSTPVDHSYIVKLAQHSKKNSLNHQLYDVQEENTEEKQIKSASNASDDNDVINDNTTYQSNYDDDDVNNSDINHVQIHQANHDQSNSRSVYDDNDDNNEYEIDIEHMIDNNTDTKQCLKALKNKNNNNLNDNNSNSNPMNDYTEEQLLFKLLNDVDQYRNNNQISSAFGNTNKRMDDLLKVLKYENINISIDKSKSDPLDSIYNLMNTFDAEWDKWTNDKKKEKLQPITTVIQCEIYPMATGNNVNPDDVMDAQQGSNGIVINWDDYNSLEKVNSIIKFLGYSEVWFSSHPVNLK